MNARQRRRDRRIQRDAEPTSFDRLVLGDWRKAPFSEALGVKPVRVNSSMRVSSIDLENGTVTFESNEGELWASETRYEGDDR